MVLLLVYVLAQIAIALVFGVAVGIYYAITDPHLAPTRLAKQLQTTPVLLSAGTLGILGGASLVLLMTRWFYRGIPRYEAYQALGLTRGSVQNFVIAAIFGLTLAGLYIWLAIKFVSAGHTPPMGLFGRAAMAGGFPRVLLAILAVLIAPPVEEFLFRGAMFAGFKRSWGQSTAILLVTVAFVLLHAPEARAFWPALIGIAITAMALAAIRIRSGSLGPPIILHACYNLGLVLAVFIPSGHS